MQSKNFFGSVCAVFAMTWSASTMATPPATQTRRFHLDAPPLRVMPLFTAEGGRDRCRCARSIGSRCRRRRALRPLLVLPLGRADRDARDRADRHGTRAHGHETTWIVIDYRPERGVASYARIVGDLEMGLVDVSCAATRGGSDVTVTYTLTPLSSDGAARVAGMLEITHFDQMIEEWRTRIDDVLKADAHKSGHP